MSTKLRQNDEVKTLIAKAGKLAGSEYKLAQALGIPQTHLSAWKSGVKNCTPPDRARLAAMANEDAVQELVRATMANTEGTLRGDQLKAVLGKWLRQTGVADVSGLLSLALGSFGMAWSAAEVDLLRCINRSPRIRQFD
jgi:DNA-binding transcriptional regulator YdaS (Cro superfamily)